LKYLDLQHTRKFNTLPNKQKHSTGFITFFQFLNYSNYVKQVFENRRNGNKICGQSH